MTHRDPRWLQRWSDVTLPGFEPLLDYCQPSGTPKTSPEASRCVSVARVVAAIRDHGIPVHAPADFEVDPKYFDPGR